MKRIDRHRSGARKAAGAMLPGLALAFFAAHPLSAVAAACAGAGTATLSDGTGAKCEITGSAYDRVMLTGATDASSTGSVTVTRNSSVSDQALRAWDSAALTINGDLTVTRTGAQNTSAAMQFGQWTDAEGAGSGAHQQTVRVTGNTLVNSSNGTAVRLVGGHQTFEGNTQVNATGGGFAIYSASGGGAGSVNVFGGDLGINTAGNASALAINGASSFDIGGNLRIAATSLSAVNGTTLPGGVRLTSGSLTVGGNTRISTLGLQGDGILAAGNSSVNLNGSTNSLSTAGANAVGVAASGGAQFQASGALAIDTQGAGAHGLALHDASRMAIGSTRIATQGDNAYGMDIASSAGKAGTLELNGALAIETQGAGSSGIHAVNSTANAVTVPVGSSILTHGEAAHGLDLQSPDGDVAGWTVAQGARIETQGAHADPVYLSSSSGKVNFASAGELVASPQGDAGIFIASAPGGANVANNGRIQFGADAGAGISAQGLGGDALIANNGAIAKTGAGANGTGMLATHDGAAGTLTLRNAGSIGSAAAPVADGLNATASSSNALLTVDNSGRIDAQGTGIAAASEGGFEVRNSGTVADGAATGLALSGAGALGGSVTNSGALLARSTALLSQTAGDVTLSNSGTLRAPEAMRVTAGKLTATNTATGQIEGTLQAAGGQLDLDNAGLWTHTGNSVLGTLRNSGSIANTAPTAGGYKTITATHYVGQGGTLRLNTWLGDDASPSDRLVIDGGSASGHTQLGVRNTGGAGAQTTGNGILLVDAQNRASTSGDAFSLAGPVSAGAYDYSLVRRDNQSWYLSSALPSPVDPSPTPEAKPSPAADVPNYRQETSLYAAVPSLAALHSAATMDDFHQRMGGAGTVAGQGGQPARLWTRVLANDGQRQGDALGVYGHHGPAYEHQTAALQLGGDIYQGRSADGTRNNAGAYLATGQTSGDVRHFNGSAAGSARIDVNSLGLYWTHQNAQGAYLDAVAQGSHYGVNANSTRMPAMKSSGTGADLSLKGGMPFSLGGAWALEPQLQLRRQVADLGEGTDLAGRINYGDVDSLVGRAGLKLGYATAGMSGWARLDVLDEFRGRSTTTVSSLAGQNGVDFDTSLHGTSAALSAGVDAPLTQGVSLYGAANYLQAFGESHGHAWGGEVGVKMAW